MSEIYCFGLFSESKCYVCKFNCKQKCMDFSQNISGVAERYYKVEIPIENKNASSRIFQSPKKKSKCPVCQNSVDGLHLFKYSKEHDKVKYMCKECGEKLK